MNQRPPLKVKPGDPVKAAKWNSIVDRLPPDQLGPGGAETSGLDPIYADMRNDTGSAQPMGSVFAVTGTPGRPVENPDDWGSDYLLAGELPTEETHKNQIVISVEAIAPGDVGRVVVVGAVLCRVNYTADQQAGEVHQFVAVTPGDTIALTQTEPGFAPVLWYPPGPADKPTHGIVKLVGTGDGVRPWVRFTTTAKIADRKVQVKVDDITPGLVHEAGHVKEGQPIERGDTLDVHDPTNMWGEIEIDATGVAYQRNLPEEHAGRWEIEDCSLPISYIKGKLTACLTYSDLTATVVFGSSANPSTVDWVQSGYNQCDMPPEVSEQGTNDYSIEAQNPFKLDAGTDAEVWIRRYTNVTESDPENLASPKPRSASTSGWEIIRVFEQKARWTEWTWTGGTPTLNSFWEGSDPQTCGTPTLSHIFDTGCLKNGDKLIACYRPEQDDYVSVASQSALYGPGQDHDVLVQDLNYQGSACLLEYKILPTKLLCIPESVEPLPQIATAPSTTVRSLDSVYVDGTNVCIAYTDYVVPMCDIGSYGAECVDICPIICQCPDFYSKPEICGPPPCDDIECQWTWQGGDAPEGNWVQTSTCFEQNPDCECSDSNAPPFTGNEKEGDVVSRPCVSPPRTCCEDPTGTEVVINLEGDGDAGGASIAFSLSAPGTLDASGGGCSATVSGMIVDVWDPGDPGNICQASANAVFGWDATAGDCLWEVFVDECNEFPGFSFKVAGCAGGDCTNAPGDCNGLTNALFETDWTGSCSDPGVLTERALHLMTPEPAEAKALLEGPEKSSLGTSFSLKHAALFTGCSCKKDVIAVMNRWKPGGVSDTKIQRVVDTMFSKNNSIDKTELFGLIKEHVNER